MKSTFRASSFTTEPLFRYTPRGGKPPSVAPVKRGTPSPALPTVQAFDALVMAATGKSTPSSEMKAGLFRAYRLASAAGRFKVEVDAALERSATTLEERAAVRAFLEEGGLLTWAAETS